MVFHRVGKGKKVIANRGYITILDQSVVQMSVEGLLDIGYILDLGNTTNRNLLSLIGITLDRHDCESLLQSFG